MFCASISIQMEWRTTTIALLLAAATGLRADDFLAVESLNRCFIEDFSRFCGTFDSLPAGFGVSSNGLDLMKAGDNGFRGSSTGGVQTGGCYAWMTGNGDIALGCQPTEDKFTPGFFRVGISNATGWTVKSVVVNFDFVYLNNENRSSSLELQYSRDGEHFAAVPGGFCVSPAIADGSNAWARTAVSCGFRLKSDLLPAKKLWLRWHLNDAGGSGSRDEYGIDNFGISFRAPPGTVITLR